MKKQKSITFNFVMNVILSMSSFIFPLITFPYVSRVLLPDGTGKVSFATSVITYFAMFAQLGIPTYGIRACAKVRDDRKKLSKTVQELFCINLLMTVVAYIAFGIALLTVPRLQQDKTLFVIISLTMIFNAIGMEWLYKALEQYTYITVRSIVFKFVALIAMFVFVRQKADYVVYGAITILASSASNIFNFINIHKYVDMEVSEKLQIKKHLKPVLVFFAMSCATTIYTHLDTVMLGFMKTDTDVGYYNAAVKIKTILVTVVTSLGTVLLPRVSYYIEKGMMEEFWKTARKAMNFVVMFSVPLFIFFILFAREGVYFLSGNAFEGAVIPMQIIMPTLLFIGMTNIMGIQMLVPMGKEKFVLYSEIAGAIVDLVLNMILIPRYAAAGAAIGTMAAEIVVWIVQLYFMRENVRILYIGKSYLTVVILAILGAICVFPVKKTEFSPMLTLVLSAVIYFGIYAVGLLITKEPLFMEMLQKFVKKHGK